jgi:hypothetical protein
LGSSIVGQGSSLEFEILFEIWVAANLNYQKKETENTAK